VTFGVPLFSVLVRTQVLPTLPPVPAQEFAAARSAADEFFRTQTDGHSAPRFVNVKVRGGAAARESTPGSL
jgi:hypothetical protein